MSARTNTGEPLSKPLYDVDAFIDQLYGTEESQENIRKGNHLLTVVLDGVCAGQSVALPVYNAPSGRIVDRGFPQ
jgi:hypothetical protein